jgi:DNA-nicking Smr family endonuclease
VARRRATAAERALWTTVTQDVRRFRPQEAARPLPPADSKPPVSQPVILAPEIVPPRSHAPGAVDGATVERLRKGRAKIDARIDLHGLHQKEAFAALMRFLDHSTSAGHRSVLIITGKGAAAQGGGVLRRNVPAWLMASPFARRILTIQPAHLIHGGDGAFYVLLRRRR